MKIQIESTDILTTMGGVPVRAWRGVTERGTRCTVFVHQVMTDRDAGPEFSRELREEPAPRELSFAVAVLQLMPDHGAKPG